MENKFFKNNNKKKEIKFHPKVKGVQIIENKNNFPISWLNMQGYCEYSMYLRFFEKLITEDTPAMKKGTQEHKKLEDTFRKTAKPSTIQQIMADSKTNEILTREMYIESAEYGIRGMIDEVQFTPNGFIIIDDKPGTFPYPSSKNQVLAYCLAFKSSKEYDGRKITAALRQRGTENIIWSEEFDQDNEKKIKHLIDRVQGLIDETRPFIPTKNKNKCNKCNLSDQCPHSLATV